MGAGHYALRNLFQKMKQDCGKVDRNILLQTIALEAELFDGDKVHQKSLPSLSHYSAA